MTDRHIDPDRQAWDLFKSLPRDRPIHMLNLIRLREIFLGVPLYLLRKAPVYVRFVFRRQVEWVRTKRYVG